MLVTSNGYSEVFLEKCRLFIDSCILIDWANDQRTADILSEIETRNTLFFCNISMLEVGFGPTDKADPEQIKIAKSIYHSDGMIYVDNSKLFHRQSNKIADPPGTRYAYNPNENEYLAARTNLIKLMEKRGFGGKRARELSNDAMIFYCAWNSRSSIVSNNIKDFHIFNEIMSEDNPNHLLPVFTIDDLEKSLTEEVSFPENITI